MIARRNLAAAALAAVLATSCRGGQGDPGGAAGSTPPPTSVPDHLTTVAPTTTAPATALPLQLDFRSLGPVRVGMTVPEAAAALGQPLQDLGSPTEACTLYGAQTGFDGVAFLVAEGVVARADVIAGTTSTPEGVTIGQSEAEAQRRYGNRLTVTPHDFHIGGHYLTLVPTDPADAGHRLVLETDGRKVTSMRAGRLPEVELTEGCA